MVSQVVPVEEPKQAPPVEAAVQPPKPPAIVEQIPSLFQTLNVAPTEPVFSYVDEGDVHQNVSLPAKTRFNDKLGKKVLIVDLETRALASTKDLEKGEYHWRKLNHISAGVFNHYTYALIHGYDYKFVNASNIADRFGSWHKPSVFANLIDDYQFVVFLDADAGFRFMHLPLEWLLNFWRIKPEHSLTMALDPFDGNPSANKDRFDRIVGNTGFVIVQNNEYTHEILKAWHECPDEVRYKGCGRWKNEYTKDQQAFAEYIRYDYEDYIKELACGDANGSPPIKNCHGRFIRHYWFDKAAIKQDYIDNVMNAITLPLQRIFTSNSMGILRNQTEKVINRYRTQNMTANATANATLDLAA